MLDVPRESAMTMLKNKKKVTTQVSGKRDGVDLSDLNISLQRSNFGLEMQTMKVVSIADVTLRQSSNMCRQYWPSNRVSYRRCGAQGRASARRHSE